MPCPYQSRAGFINPAPAAPLVVAPKKGCESAWCGFARKHAGCYSFWEGVWGNPF
jgi:hypothetical protein